jgi:hypothetical protein
MVQHPLALDRANEPHRLQAGYSTPDTVAMQPARAIRTIVIIIGTMGDLR